MLVHHVPACTRAGITVDQGQERLSEFQRPPIPLRPLSSGSGIAPQ